LIVITAADLRDLLKEAEESPRKRAVLNPHREDDPLGFFHNALIPGTYVQPHKHEGKDEFFQIVIGQVLVVIFDDNGEIQSVELLSQQHRDAESCRINPGEWHSVIALEPSVLLEVKLGPYDPSTAKTFAPWAPTEEDPEASEFLAKMTRETIHAG